MGSQHFWPQLLGEDMRLHPSMEKRLDEFSKVYSVIKNPRLLVWKKQVKVFSTFLRLQYFIRSIMNAVTRKVRRRLRRMTSESPPPLLSKK